MDTHLLTLSNRKEWRGWLAANHARVEEVWLVYYKKGTGKPSIPYGASVEEALCYGWIDSLIKSLDEDRYQRKFTPRRVDSQWSALNIQRAEKMIQAGLMTVHGLRLVDAAKREGWWAQPAGKPRQEFQIHPEFETALGQNPKADQVFNQLAPSYQRQFITWIGIAKRAETRQKRIAEALRLLARGEKLGLR